ncbi:hypothetical protein Tco_1026550 [Tanacetum coccineum]
MIVRKVLRLMKTFDGALVDEEMSNTRNSWLEESLIVDDEFCGGENESEGENDWWHGSLEDAMNTVEELRKHIKELKNNKLTTQRKLEVPTLKQDD